MIRRFSTIALMALVIGAVGAATANVDTPTASMVEVGDIGPPVAFEMSISNVSMNAESMPIVSEVAELLSVDVPEVASFVPPSTRLNGDPFLMQLRLPRYLIT